VSESARQSENRSDAGEAGVYLRVVGCGNPHAGDDSVGLEVVRRLRARGEGACELLEMPQASVEMLDLLQGAGVVLFVDAVSSGAPPGTVHLVPLPSSGIETRALGALSSHGWGLAEMLGLAGALRRPTPRLMLLGVEVGVVRPGEARTAAVEGAVEIVVEKFPQLRVFLTGAGERDGHDSWRFPPGDTTFPVGNGDAPIAVGGQ
jgi:hydrogenase maturation protease